MADDVISIEPELRWEPNAPDAVLITDDLGRACLALNAHFDDEDQRAVVLVWTGVTAVQMGAPNDEVRHRHRLYNRGLLGLLWLGEVSDSSWAAELATMTAHPPRRHFLVPLKEDTVEVVAATLSIERRSGSTREVASLSA